MTEDDVAAELGDVLAGTAAVRTHPDDIVVFDSTGTAVQDTAVAAAVYNDLRAGERAAGLDLWSARR